MEIVDAVLLGLVQGLTEFIPVSSSGHLILLDEATSVESSFSFDVLLNTGTLLALLIYFKKKLLTIARQIIKQEDDRLARNVVLSTIPAVFVGGLFTDLFSEDGVRNLNVVIFMLIAVGIAMIVVDYTAKGAKKFTKLNIRDALFIGVAQAMALVPGTSRSGSTILAGRLTGLSYRQAAEYSFLIAIPILIGAILRSLLEPETTQLLQDYPLAVAAGVVASFVAGMLAIHIMLSFLSNHGLKIFGVYRIIMALALLLFID